MLEEVRSRGAQGLLIMTDSAFHSGLRLLYSFITAALQRAELVHVFGYEVPEEEFRAGLPPELSSSLTFHDGFSDPLHWETSVPSLTLQRFSAQGVLERVGRPRGPLTVVFHSLSWILLRCPLPYVCHQLRELSGLQSEHGDTRVVALLHADLHEPGVLRSVCLLADTVIALSDQGEKASVLQRRRSGKVVTCMETFRVHDDFSLETTRETDEEPENRAPATFGCTWEALGHISRSRVGLTSTSTSQCRHGYMLEVTGELSVSQALRSRNPPTGPWYRPYGPDGDTGQHGAFLVPRGARRRSSDAAWLPPFPPQKKSGSGLDLLAPASHQPLGHLLLPSTQSTALLSDQTSAEVDPTVNLTFNLRLSETERERKETATLPYTFTDSKKMCLLRASSASAKIFYDAEPADDVDEEDPDDDLDV